MANQLLIHDILKMMMHRYPMLLVDRVLDMELGKTIHAVKNVTINEPFFEGHFPDLPVMPGVLIIEAMAQACGLLMCQSEGYTPDSGFVFLLASVDDVRFKKPVTPGDQLHLHGRLVKHRKDLWKFEAKALVDDKLASSATLMCAVKPREIMENHND